MVGAGATVMDGATISSGAMVAPGAIVSPNTTVPTGQVGDARLPGRDGGVCRSAPADAGGLFFVLRQSRLGGVGRLFSRLFPTGFVTGDGHSGGGGVDESCEPRRRLKSAGVDHPFSSGTKRALEVKTRLVFSCTRSGLS